jgi:hypothetical protein
MRYIVERYHKIGSEVFQAGQGLEISDPDYAAWLSRDMQGHLHEVKGEPEPAPASEPEVRVLETPPADRMVRKARRRSQA